jgi:hypothetical protein
MLYLNQNGDQRIGNMKKSKKEMLIKQRLEFFDAVVESVRQRIKAGSEIPSLKVLIQPK